MLPPSAEDTRTLIGIYALERALAETANELQVRPDWVIVPLLGIQALLSR